MSAGIRIKVFEVGSCVHPGFMVNPKLGIKPKKFPAGVALIEHPQQGRILFDTGYHRQFTQCTQHFPERLYALTTPHTLEQNHSLKDQLARHAITTEQIDHIILSHFHADHIAGVCDFKQAALHCHPDGYRFLTQASRLQRIRKGVLSGLLPEEARSRLNFCDTFPLDISEIPELNLPRLGLAVQDMFGDGQLYLVSLPGHAAGQLGLLAKLTDHFLFFLADACWLIDNLRDGINQHWLAGIICDDRKAYQATLTKLRKAYQELNGQVMFIPTHCEATWADLLSRGWLD